jgi:hypothetical protein
MACSVLFVAEKSAPPDSCAPISKLLDEHPAIAKQVKMQHATKPARFIHFVYFLFMKSPCK